MDGHLQGRGGTVVRRGLAALLPLVLLGVLLVLWTLRGNLGALTGN